MHSGVCIVQGEPPMFKKGLTKRNCAFVEGLLDRGIETHVVLPSVDDSETIPDEFEAARLHTVEIPSVPVGEQLVRGYKLARVSTASPSSVPLSAG